MLHLNREAPGQAALGGGFGGFDFGGIWVISSAISLVIFWRRQIREGQKRTFTGANIKTSVRITFEEAVFGCDKEIEINFKETCASCHGTGAKGRHLPSDLFQV